MKIFLDDIRFPVGLGEGWSIVRNVIDFEYMWTVNRNNITHISFDHDMGEGVLTGYDALVKVEEDVLAGEVTNIPIMTVHSMNPVGREKMEKVIKKLESFR